MKYIGICRCFSKEIEAANGGESSFSGFVPVEPLCMHPSANPEFGSSENPNEDFFPCNLLSDRALNRHPGNCLSMLLPSDVIDQLQANGSFLVSAGWLSSWRSFMDSWGLTREIARQFLGETAHRILVLDTGLRGDLVAECRDLSEFAGIPVEPLKVGMSFFLEKSASFKTLHFKTAASRKPAERVPLVTTESGFAMALDLINQIASLGDTSNCVGKVLETFAMLFAPQEVLLIPSCEGLSGTSWSYSLGLHKTPIVKPPCRCVIAAGESEPTFDDDSMCVPLVHNGVTLGILCLSGIEHPEYGSRYTDISKTVAGVSALALNNSMTFEKLKVAYANIQDAQEKIRILRGILPICAGCKKIRDDKGYWKDLEDYIARNSEAVMSHGICPECSERLYPDLADEIRDMKRERSDERGPAGDTERIDRQTPQTRPRPQKT